MATLLKACARPPFELNQRTSSAFAKPLSAAQKKSPEPLLGGGVFEDHIHGLLEPGRGEKKETSPEKGNPKGFLGRPLQRQQLRVDAKKGAELEVEWFNGTLCCPIKSGLKKRKRTHAQI